jgi:hypothetical protein
MDGGSMFAGEAHQSCQQPARSRRIFTSGANVA